MEQSNQGPPKIAVIGSGYWGKNLVRNYHQLDALRLICDRSEAVLSDLKSTYPDIETCVALSDVLAHRRIDGVVIATPAETHYTLAREVLLAGKHVFVEKPLALRESEGEELLRIAEGEKRVLMVGHVLQYHPVFVCLKNLVAVGELGKINYIYSHRLNLGKIRREENILWSFAPHDISMILALAGELPESVMTTGGNYLHQKIADVTTTHFHFPSGLRAHIFVSWLHPFKEQKLVVVGEQKMAVFDDTQPWPDKLLLYPHQIRWQNQVPIPTKAEPERPDIPQDEPLKLECRHFLECISDSKQPVTDASEGIRVLKILNASQRSLDEDGSNVGLAGSHPRISSDHAAGTQSREAVSADFYAHPSTVIDPETRIGNGTKIWHFSHILSGTTIGEGCSIGQNVVIGPDVSIGRGCKIQNNVSVYQGVTLEDDVFCGPSMVFTNVYNPRAELRKMDQAKTTLVRKGATIGANATIVCGVTLGRYSFVGAGAVVNRSVKDHALMVGNPAGQIGWTCKCGERLNDQLTCDHCNRGYRKATSGLEAI